MNCPHCHKPFVLVAVAAEGATAPAPPRVAGNAGECPRHRKPWTYREGGISKTSGKAYGGFWKCDEKDGDEWCKERPSRAWTPPAPQPPREPIGEPLDDLPF